MQVTGTRRLTGAGRAAAAAATGVVGLLAPSARLALEQIRSTDFPVAGVAAAHLAALAIAVWVLVVVAAGTVRLRVPGVPRSMRALLFTSVAIAAVATPARADSGHDLTGLTLPDRPVAAQQTVAATTAATVTVRSGDTLWALASARLPDRANDAQIAIACTAWHRTNREVIGPDPDLIVPGQILRPPTHGQDTP